MPIIEYIKKYQPEFLPPAIPEDLADRIVRLHGDPVVWWVSQFLKYMLRPQDNIALLLNETEKDMDQNNPMVGIHIRRTDKIIEEAAFHEVDEYMKYVEEYFQQIEIKAGYTFSPKRVYVATDDSKCIKRMPEKIS